MELEHEIKEYEEKINSLTSVKRNFMRSLFEGLPDEITGGFRLQPRTESVYSAYYEVEEDEEGNITYGDKVISAKPEGFDLRRVLKKEADRGPGSMYENIAKVPSFQFVLELEAPSEEIMDEWTDEVIVNLHKLLSKKNEIEKVRYTSCEVTTKKEGECFI